MDGVAVSGRNGTPVSKIPVEGYIFGMRSLWIGALVVLALLGAACSGAADSTTSTTIHHHARHRHRTTTTTTTTPTATTAPTAKLASGPNDRLACGSFTSLSRDIGKSHRVVVAAFLKLFRQAKQAENVTLKNDAHAAAKALYLGNITKFKHDFTAVYLLCYSIQVGTPST